MFTGLTEQLPFAYSRAINKTVDSAQAAIKTSLPSDFTLRQATFIQNTIYRQPGQDFATKANLVGSVRVNPARDFLAKFEDGGEKRSISGRSLAIPVMRLDAPNIIIGRSDPLNIKRIMSSIQAFGGRVVTPRLRKGQLRVKQIGSAFLIKTARGTFVVERTGPGAGDTKLLYKFEGEVPIQPQLHFEDTAMAAALASFEQNFNDAIDYAMATAK